MINDLWSAARFWSYGAIAGLVLFFGLTMVSHSEGFGKKKVLRVWPITFLVMYATIMLMLTFFSREGGQSNGVDLQLFSTWGINDRNNAYVFENILLFVPYGFLLAWNFTRAKNFFVNFFWCVFTSVCIEFLQLITGRGFFQVDDIITNVIGGVIGFLIFTILNALFGKKH